MGECGGWVVVNGVKDGGGEVTGDEEEAGFAVRFICGPRADIRPKIDLRLNHNPGSQLTHDQRAFQSIRLASLDSEIHEV